MKRFLESNLEEIIYTADRKELEDRGLRIPAKAKLLRQVRIGNYGIADLISVNKVFSSIDQRHYLDIDLFELKKDAISINAFLQAVGYAQGIHSYLIDHRSFVDYKLSVTLIGSEIDNSGTFCFLPDLIKADNNYDSFTNGEIRSLSFVTYDYKIDGIRFKYEDGYKLINEGF